MEDNIVKLYLHNGDEIEIVLNVMTPEQFIAIYNDEDDEYDI